MKEYSIRHPSLARLKEIPAAPEKIYVEGDPSSLGLYSIAVVGTRQPSSYGLQASFTLARELASRGLVIVSGLARGIDTAAHAGALASGGRTIAVLGHGLDRVYPARNVGLAASIVEKGGCLVSEYPPGVPPLAHHFPARNRIIAGLSLGTLVVEAAVRSGSLITARYAMEQGRDVFVVPGRLNDTSFGGAHALIQQGAKLVQEVNDILCEYAWLSRVEPTNDLPGPDWDWISTDTETVSLADIRERSGLSAQEIFSKIDEAVEKGWLHETGPQSYVWTGQKISFHPAPCQNQKISQQ